MADANLLGTLVGAASILGFGLYQIYAPKYLNRDTALAPIIEDVPQTVEEIKNEQAEIKEKQAEMRIEVDNLGNQQQKLTNVTVAQSHTLNGYEGHMDVDTVEDDLLDEDGKSPDDYLTDNGDDSDE